MPWPCFLGGAAVGETWEDDFMNLNEIKEIIDFMKENDIAELDVD